MERSERQKALITKLGTNFKRGSASTAVIDTLELPKFLYFSQYERMRGQVAVDALIQRKANGKLEEDDRVFLALCDLAGTTLEGIGQLNQFEPVVAKFEAASIKIYRKKSSATGRRTDTLKCSSVSTKHSRETRLRSIRVESFARASTTATTR